MDVPVSGSAEEEETPTALPHRTNAKLTALNRKDSVSLPSFARESL